MGGFSLWHILILALLVLLADADEDRAVSQVDVVAVERERLCRAHRGDREQPDQRLMP